MKVVTRTNEASATSYRRLASLVLVGDVTVGLGAYVSVAPTLQVSAGDFTLRLSQGWVEVGLLALGAAAGTVIARVLGAAYSVNSVAVRLLLFSLTALARTVVTEGCGQAPANFALGVAVGAFLTGGAAFLAVQLAGQTRWLRSLLIVGSLDASGIIGLATSFAF